MATGLTKMERRAREAAESHMNCLYQGHGEGLSSIPIIVTQQASDLGRLFFEATGAFRDEGQIQSLTLDVQRTDAVEGTIDLEYVRDFSDESLKLVLNAQEAAGGLVAVMGGLYLLLNHTWAGRAIRAAWRCGGSITTSTTTQSATSPVSPR